MRALAPPCTAFATVALLSFVFPPLLLGQAPTPPSGVRDSAGVAIVDNPGTDRSLPWTVSRVLRLGDALGPPESSFFKLNPYSVAGGPAGTILVLNRGSYRIVVFSGDGKVLRSFGRQGQGPGEMQNPVSLWVDPTDRIRVLDWAGGILNYDINGELTSEDTSEPVALGQHVEETRAGLVHTFSVGFRSDTLLREQIRLAQDRDTLILAEWLKIPTTRVQHPSCPLQVQFSPIFEPEMVWDANNDEVAVLSGYLYQVDFYGPDGTQTRSVRRAVEELRATQRDAVRELGPTPGFRIRGKRCVWDPEELVQERGFYPLIQPLEALALAPDGHMWARRKNPGDEPGSIDIFDSGGNYLGTLPGLAPFPAAFLDSTHFLTIETDEFEVEYVSVYEIDRS